MLNMYVKQVFETEPLNLNQDKVGVHAHVSFTVINDKSNIY